MADPSTPHVKRSPNPYMIYSKAERANVAAAGFKTNRAVTKELARRWNAFTDEERSPWLEEAKRMKAQHKQDHPDYKYQPKKKVKKADGSVEKNKQSSRAASPYVIPQPKKEKEMPIIQPEYPSLPALQPSGPFQGHAYGQVSHGFQYQPPVQFQQQQFYNYPPTIFHRPTSNGSPSSSSMPSVEDQWNASHANYQQYGYEYHGLL